jgi:xylulose-5-phosphate/fructose-6-phosphate phosphoketolase
VANTYLEGTYSEVYPNISQDEEGMKRLFTSSRSPAASPATSRRKRPAPSTKAANWATPWSHAYGAAFDNPDLLVACVVGDGEAETGPLATSWHSNKFLNPVRDGAVLPILHLNGYKIANPHRAGAHPATKSWKRSSRLRLHAVFRRRRRPGEKMHQLMAATLDRVIAEIRASRQDARANGFKSARAGP